MKKTKFLSLIVCLSMIAGNAMMSNTTTINPNDTPTESNATNPTQQPTVSVSGGDEIPAEISLQPKPISTSGSDKVSTKTSPKITISISGCDTSPNITPIQQKPKSTSIPDNLHGLNNIGGSCYLNSLVQVLYHTKKVHDYVIGTTFEKKETQNLKLLFEDMDKAPKSAVINPRARYAGMGFHHGPDDPEFVFVSHLTSDLEKLTDLDTEMDNPVLIDGMPSANPSEKTAKGKTAVGCSIATCRTGGHYYAIVKENDKWFTVNDSGVSYLCDDFSGVIAHVKNTHHMFRMISYE